MERYKVGFEEGVNCFWADDNPGRIAIVDMKSVFAFGECVALADSQEIAEKIVNALNMVEKLKSHILPSLGV